MKEKSTAMEYHRGALKTSSDRFNRLFMGDFHGLHDPVHDLIGVGVGRRAPVLEISLPIMGRGVHWNADGRGAIALAKRLSVDWVDQVCSGALKLLRSSPESDVQAWRAEVSIGPTAVESEL